MRNAAVWPRSLHRPCARTLTFSLGLSLSVEHALADELSEEALPKLVQSQDAGELDERREDLPQTGAPVESANPDSVGAASSSGAPRSLSGRDSQRNAQPVSGRSDLDSMLFAGTEWATGPGLSRQNGQEAASSVRLSLDEHGKRTLALDNTAPLSDTLLYRLTVAGEDSDSVRRTDEGDISTRKQSYSLASAIRYRPDSDNSYTLRLKFAEQDWSGEEAEVTPTDEHDSRESRLQFDWLYQLADGWQNRLQLSHYHQQIDDYSARMPPPSGRAPAGPPPGRPPGSVPALVQDVDEHGVSVANTLSGDYQLGTLASTLTLKASYADQKVGLTAAEHRFSESGFAIQNRTWLTGQLRLLTGVRYDLLRSDQPQASARHDDLSAQLGLSYQYNRQLALYAAFAESYLPNNPEVPQRVVMNDVAQVPEQSAKYELGVKGRFLADRLTLTAALYHLSREQVKAFEGNRARLHAEEQGRGLDLNARVQLLPGWSLLTDYNYLDTEIVDDGSSMTTNEGNQPVNAPLHRARIWSQYAFQAGRLKGSGFGLGAEYASGRFADNANTERLPGYTIFDTAVWYRMPLGQDKQLRLQAGIRNLADRKYYKLAANDRPLRNRLGDRRTFYLNATLAF